MTNFNIKKYSSILFDLDGTILNSEPIHMRALQSVLNEYKIFYSLNKLNKSFHGIDDTAIYKIITTNHQELQINQEAFIAKKNSYYLQELQAMSQDKLESLIVPGFHSFFNKIERHSKIGVVSASEKDIVYSTLQRLNILNRLSIVEFRKDGVKSKPSPQPYLDTIKYLGDTPETTLIFEDSSAGLKAATSSGSDVIQVCFFTHKDSKRRQIIDFNQL